MSFKCCLLREFAVSAAPCGPLAAEVTDISIVFSSCLMQVVQSRRTLGGPTLTSKSTVRPTRRNLAHPDVSCSPRNRVQLAQTAADFHSLPTSLEAAAAEMALQAAPGSSWPAKTHAVIDAAHRAVGGNFLLVVCGHWADLHPRAETSAFALLQMVFVSVDEGDGLYKVHGKPGWCQLGPATTDCCKIRERSSTKP
jgi:hypothetical protein